MPDNERMNTQAATVVERLGDTAEVARMFEVKMPSVSDWKKFGIPKARMMFIKAVRPDVLDGIDVDAATASSAPHLQQAEAGA